MQESVLSSGIPDFRSKNGFWNNNENCDNNITSDFIQKFHNLNTYNSPNEIHHWIKKIQKEYGEDCKVYTLNIDTLLEKADVNVEHLHGRIDELKCTKCGMITEWGDTNFGEEWIEHRVNSKYKYCKKCNGEQKVNIVMFGEKGNYEGVMNELFDMTKEDILLVLGTSCTTFLVDLLVQHIEGLKILVVNNVQGIRLQGFNIVYDTNIEDMFKELELLILEKIGT